MLLDFVDNAIVSLSYLESNFLQHYNSISNANGCSSPTFFLSRSLSFVSIIALVFCDAIGASCCDFIPTMMLKYQSIACIITTIHHSNIMNRSSLITMNLKDPSCCKHSSLPEIANASSSIINFRRLSRIPK